MSNIYCISGLGADHRFFSNIAIPGHTLVPVPWVPYSERDTLPSYALKLADTIADPSPIIIGCSFGGMLATEIARHRPGTKAFLISSAKTRKEVGYNNELLAKVANVIPTFMFGHPSPLLMYMLGATTDDEKQVIAAMLKAGNHAFDKWALNAILNWQGQAIPDNLVHIHGTADRVITPENVKPSYWIKDGSHIMLYNRAAEVSAIVSSCLAGQ